MENQYDQAAIAEPPLIPERVLQFMNGLPVTGDTVAWILRFRESLQALLGDVDRIACSVNLFCDLRAPESYTPWMHLGTHVRASPGTHALLPQTSNTTPPRFHSILDELRRSQQGLDEYQLPRGYDYFVSGTAYVATVILFRKKGLSPISECTYRTMEDLEPFFIFAFSGFVARHYMAKPVDQIFGNVLTRAQVSAKLSKPEWQVMALHLMGLTYAQIANRLFISENTVAKHVKSVYRKTGCSSFLELFAPYFRDPAEDGR
jgi:DNA-binding CsgD family transcriptional regulator